MKYKHLASEMNPDLDHASVTEFDKVNWNNKSDSDHTHSRYEDHLKHSEMIKHDASEISNLPKGLTPEQVADLTDYTTFKLEVKGEIDKVSSVANDAVSKSSSNSQDISNISKSVSTNSDDIDTNKKSISSLSLLVDGIKNSVNSALSSISDIFDNIKSINEAIRVLTEFKSSVGAYDSENYFKISICGYYIIGNQVSVLPGGGSSIRPGYKVINAYVTPNATVPWKSSVEISPDRSTFRLRHDYSGTLNMNYIAICKD